MGNGINAGSSADLFFDCPRIHLCTKFVLKLWLRGMLVIDAPDLNDLAFDGG